MRAVDKVRLTLVYKPTPAAHAALKFYAGFLQEAEHFFVK